MGQEKKKTVDGSATEPTPSESMLRMISGFWVSRAIYVALKLNLPDLLRDGPKGSEELARATGTHGPSLYRVLRALASVGLFTEDEAGRFAATPLACTLQSGAPGSLRAFALMELGNEHYPAWGAVLHSILSGTIAFNHVYGMDAWEYRARHPDDSKIFDEAMADFTALVDEAIQEGYDFSGIKRVVDVGGGNGSLLVSLLGSYPAMRGVLFDLPHVAEGGKRLIEERGLGERCEVVPGNFFAGVPEGGDAYLLKWIIHDWDDGQSVAILKNCRRAMAKGGRLLLIEAIIPPGNGPAFHKLMDLNMLVMTGGRERTEAEYRLLLETAGFGLTKITPTSFEMSVIEGTPV